MSSHHFVKEGQEAALVVLDPVEFHSIASVLEWSPLVVVYEKALNKVLSWSIKIDVVVCESSSVDELSRKLEHQVPLRFLTLASGGRGVEDVLNFLSQEGNNSVMIALSNPDTLMDRLIAGQKIRPSLIAQGIRWSLISTGSYEKWLSSGDELSLREPLPQQMEGVSFEAGKATATQDGLIRLRNQAPFWVGEKL